MGRRAMNRGAWVVLLAAGVGMSGCVPADQETGSVTQEELEGARTDLSAEALAQLDSGSVAVRADAFDEALRHYRRVVELAPDAPAGWFGLYMTELALGNTLAADSALERVRSLAPGASLVRDTAGGG